MASFNNIKSISIILDNVNFHRIHSDMKNCAFTLCTMFLYIFFGIANLVVLSLFIPPFQLQTPDVHLDSITIKSLDTKAIDLTAKFNVTFIFHTPNYDQQTVSYRDVEVIVWWPGKDDILLGRTILSAFTQGADSVTMIGAELMVAEGLSNTSDVSIAIGAERDNGSVKIGVTLLGLFMVRDGACEAMRFDYDPVAVKFPAGSNNGSWTRVIPRPVLMRNFMV